MTDGMTLQVKSLHKKTRDELKHYVYCLVDPRNNEIFYVGKGRNDRVFNRSYNKDDETEKP